MAGSASVATMLAPSLVPLERLPMAVALLPIVRTNRQCGSSSFTADIDAAEKGTHTSLVDLNSMKRTSTTKKPAANPERAPMAEQASTTGADRYAEVDTGINSSIEQEPRETTKGQRRTDAYFAFCQLCADASHRADDHYNPYKFY
jgi:hypothetical protein